jgi:hypothetical protein
MCAIHADSLSKTPLASEKPKDPVSDFRIGFSHVALHVFCSQTASEPLSFNFFLSPVS